MANVVANRLQIEERLISSLKPFPRNARVHSKKQIHQIASAIREFGFTNPVLIDQSDVIMAGHGRVEAAKLLGLDRIPTIRLEHLNEAQKRAYVIADNRRNTSLEVTLERALIRLWLRWISMLPRLL